MCLAAALNNAHPARSFGGITPRGTPSAAPRWQRMSIRCTVENAFFIAWSFLEQSGELGPPDESANVILDAIEAQLRTGERRQLKLANTAIHAYRTHAAKSRSSHDCEARFG